MNPPPLHKHEQERVLPLGKHQGQLGGQQLRSRKKLYHSGMYPTSPNNPCLQHSTVPRLWVCQVVKSLVKTSSPPHSHHLSILLLNAHSLLPKFDYQKPNVATTIMYDIVIVTELAIPGYTIIR